VSATDESLPFKPDPKIRAAISRLKNPEGQVPLDFQRESRFAVVMYGGVSLAIYINGVAQELLNMVRATAPGTTDGDAIALVPAKESDLSGAMGVYRKLGQYLSHRNRNERDEKLRAPLPTTDPIRTRFIVDIISGTSAGGINGVFLAKALARNQGMEGLKKLWLREGDLAKLLNDKFSLDGLRGFKLTKPQGSLLNSQRMYRKLLEALDNMDVPRDKNAPPSQDNFSPLIHELDLFITTTDIEGVPLPISLFDDVVFERRYKNVFHFRYATPAATGSLRDDFVKENDPFLAFAARCTSSFPFAFEAMRLCDITSIANAYAPYKDRTESGAWDAFFSDYLRNGLFDLDREAHGKDALGYLPNAESADEARKQLRAAFCARSFGDGGYLDNKPFSHATSMLSRRFADSAVARKLLYVEPTPEHPELAVDRREQPDFAENVHAAVLDLPRQETIREDLDRLYERNELLERVTMLTKEVDADIAAERAEKIDKKKFQTEGLNQMIDHYGVSYGAYHRLKVSELTNLLAELVSRAAGHDPTSDAADAIRELVKAWRRSQYHPLIEKERKNPKDHGKKTENEFLRNFDIRYRLRRLAFLNHRINVLAVLDEDSKSLLEKVREHEPKLWPAGLEIKDLIENPENAESFQDELNDLKKNQIAPALKEARAAEEKLRQRDFGPGKELNDAIGELKIGWPDLERILKRESGVQRNDEADAVLAAEDRGPTLFKLAQIICDAFKLQQKVEIPANDTNPSAKAARVSLQHYDAKFLFYDLVTYPIQYGTGAGETNVVDVFRVSPEDARNLIDERASDSDATKLAGRAVMSFGAFFDESWRRNDMLWGRLDGAERIISALLSEDGDEDVRKDLVNEAHLGILNQEIADGNADAVCRLLSHALKHAKAEEPCGKNLQNLVRKVFAQNANGLAEAQKTALSTPKTFDRQLQPRRALEYISRSTNITGDMLTGLADKYHTERGKKIARWIATIGSTLWSLIAVAVPQSLGNLFYRHVLGLLYFFALVLIFAGIFLNNSVKFAGWQMLGILVLFQMTVTGVAAFMRGNRWFMKLIVGAIVSPLLAWTIVGIIRATETFSDVQIQRSYEFGLAVAATVAIVFFSIVGPYLYRKTRELGDQMVRYFFPRRSN
jgi:patatin-related protein